MTGDLPEGRDHVRRLLLDLEGLVAEVQCLQVSCNSARTLIERHRAKYGNSHFLSTALQELDDACPSYVQVPSDLGGCAP